MYGGNLIYPFHQNVLWTFILGLLCITIIEKIRKKGNIFLTILTFILTTIIGFILGFLTMVDYFGHGILIILLFYFFRKKEWWCLIGQFIGLYWISVELISGLAVPIQILNHEIYIVQQSLSCLALIPIWFYNGTQGPYNKYIQLLFYAFYPIHMLILSLSALL